MISHICFCLIFILLNGIAKCDNLIPCGNLLMGQYFCHSPIISTITQQPTTCAEDNSITVKCFTRPGLECLGKDNETDEFVMRIQNACRYSTGSNHITALLLSVFLGAIGADRFYLGHFTIGLFKLFSCGFFFILYIADIVFIALEIITPSDSSSYFVNQYGPRVLSSQFTNETMLMLYNCFDCVA